MSERRRRLTNSAARAGKSERRRRPPPKPVEHRMLVTATLCLLAFGAVMVYSASSARNLLAGGGDGTHFLVRYLMFGSLGLVAMHVLARRGLQAVERLTPVLLAVSFALVLLVLVPGFGVQVNGAKRWLGAAALQFQPSELMKLALVLYAARFLARHPRRIQTFRGMLSPLLVVFGGAALLVALEPDLGTALVIAFTAVAMLVAAGVPLRYLGYLAAGLAVLVLLFALVEPYRRARLTTFVDPWAHSGGAGFQAVQGQIAFGSGGLFGVGLGRSVQKVFYLPEAHTDFILAVIGEELGLLGLFGVLALYGMILWAGLRTARRAAGAYAKLLAAGLTSLILCQATLNIFVVLGLAPLTGVPLPLISYGQTNLCVLLAAIGLLLNVAAGNTVRLRVVEGGDERTADRDRRRRDRGARRARAGGGRRAAG
jgi:cell division protein FtsW